jgi:hypothetical protein
MATAASPACRRAWQHAGVEQPGSDATGRRRYSRPAGRVRADHQGKHRPVEVQKARRTLASMGFGPRPRPVPPPGFDPEASAVDSLVWIGVTPRRAGPAGTSIRDRPSTATVARGPCRADPRHRRRFGRSSHRQHHALRHDVAGRGPLPARQRPGAAKAARSIHCPSPDVQAEALLEQGRQQEAWEAADRGVRLAQRWSQLEPRSAQGPLHLSRNHGDPRPGWPCGRSRPWWSPIPLPARASRSTRTTRAWLPRSRRPRKRCGASRIILRPAFNSAGQLGTSESTCRLAGWSRATTSTGTGGSSLRRSRLWRLRARTPSFANRR